MFFIRTPGIASIKKEGIWLILENNNSHIRELNDMAGFIWELLETKIEMEQIVDKIVKAYEASDRKEVEKDVDNFLTNYESYGLVVRIS